MNKSHVTTVTDELIAELEAAANAATPGPWLLEQTTVYALNDERIQCNRFTASVDSGWLDDSQRISRDEVNANAKHISLSSPATILALLAERADLKLQLAAAIVDAERYRWLREACDNDPGNLGIEYACKPGVDAAIDAAMECEK